MPRRRKPHKETTKEKIRDAVRKAWSDSDKRLEQSKRMSLIFSEKTISEEEHKRRSEARRNRHPSTNVNAMTALSAYWENPANRLAQSEKVKRRYADPNERLKTSIKSKEVMNTPEVKKKCSDSAKRRLERPEEMERLVRQSPEAARILSLTSPTSIEKLVMRALDELKIPYDFQVTIGPFVADFVVGDLIIEADGEPWHEDKAAERRRDGYMKREGYRVLHLTDKVIWKDPKPYILEAVH